MDDEEAKQFNNSTLKYLVKNIKIYKEKGVAGQISLKEGLSSELPQHMCKEFIVAAQRTDINNTNNWLKFSKKILLKWMYIYMQNYLLQLAEKQVFMRTLMILINLNTNLVENLSRFVLSTDMTLNLG